MEEAHPSRKTRPPRPALALALFALTTLPALGQAGLGQRYEFADLRALETAFVGLAEEVRPSVVAIRTYYVRDPDNAASNRVAIPVSQGSGFIIDAHGFIATNRHVLEDANSINVILHTGQRYPAKIVETDKRTDLAVVAIEAEDLVPIKWGDLTEVKVNQWTFACGNPFGLANEDGNSSITFGAVSALGRRMTDKLAADASIQYYGNLIETSSTINPGNSGGPLFNLEGEVIGVVTAIATSSGVSEGHGYAIPIDSDTRRIIEKLKAGQTMHYGYMGVRVEDVEPPQSRRVAHSPLHDGARIIGVSPADGPAAAAGLQRGDVIISVDGNSVNDSDHLVRLIQFTEVGTEIEITYLRRTVKQTTKLTLADRDDMLRIDRRN